uniref:Protein KTI12 homolog n=1 Tax=Salmo trutta TaxID=8032 RepID=A0A674CV15_SALTR
MPLIVMCGYPCSGKTRRSVELQQYFEQNTERKVHNVGDGTLGIEKNAVYADSQNEKNVRGSLRAEAERYELFCLIKHTQTPHCLTHGLWFCFCFHSLDALVLRFETPDSRNRWDSPLFTIQKEDTLPFEAISDAIFKRKAPPPNQSTQSQPLSSTNFLYELDKVTQDVLMAILNSQKTSVPGDLIAVPGATEKISFATFCILNMAELRKLRRQFISYTKMHPTENIGHIANMFVQYLNKSIH